MKLSSSPAEVYPERASSSSTLGKSVRGNVMATPPARASAGLSTSRWTDLIRESWDKGSERGREAIAGDGDAASQDVTVPTPSEIAATLHSSTHTPQSMHNSSFTSAFSDTNAIASVGHTSTQDPQPVHFLISTCTVMNFSFLVLSMPNASGEAAVSRRLHRLVGSLSRHFSRSITYPPGILLFRLMSFQVGAAFPRVPL